MSSPYLNTLIKQVIHRKCGVGEERKMTINEEVKKLRYERSIKEIIYIIWMENVVVVKMMSGKWIMFLDFTYLNLSCPKILYHLPNIEKLIDDLSR